MSTMADDILCVGKINKGTGERTLEINPNYKIFYEKCGDSSNYKTGEIKWIIIQKDHN